MSNQSLTRPALWIIGVMCCILSSSCVFTPRSIHSETDKEEKCRRSVSLSSFSSGKTVRQSDLNTILPSYPENVVMIASAIGILPELRRLADLKNQVKNQVNPESNGSDVQILDLHYQLLSHVVLIMLEVNSAVAEAQCEKAQVIEIADRMQKAQDSQNQLMTLASIITSGVTGILGGVFTLTDSVLVDSIIAITGGTIASVFAGYTLLERADYTLDHSRNILREVWEGPEESNIFPPSVWRFLTSPRRDQRTPREIIVEKWKSRVGISIEGTEKEKELAALLFSDGGTYGLSDLRTRAAMLSMLASTIDLIEHDVEELMREILTTRTLFPKGQ